MDKANQLEITPLHCSENGITCPMAIRDTVCESVARAMVRAATRHDPTYELDTHLPLSEAATVLGKHLKLGAIAQAAGETACRTKQQFYNQTAAESLMASIYS